MSVSPAAEPVAILYQGTNPPVIDGIRKPMKPGGYSDSGADIGCALAERGVRVITPVPTPHPASAFDWIFPDTVDGIEQALSLGARVIWANTILFNGHPLQAFFDRPLLLVGQPPEVVHQYDDKWVTNRMLRASGQPVARSVLVGLLPAPDTIPLDALSEPALAGYGLSFPVMLKPIRGRGSEAVTKVDTLNHLIRLSGDLLSRTVEVDGVTYLKYGSSLMIEEYIDGAEITLTVMPPGDYAMGGAIERRAAHWCLPPIERFNHVDGVAPYNGEVAVVRNSLPVPMNDALAALANACAITAARIGARAPIRVDCRQMPNGQYVMFDVNMKPNMTGAGRPGRDDQDSLSCMAAREIGWSYGDLLLNMLAQAWAPVPA